MEFRFIKRTTNKHMLLLTRELNSMHYSYVDMPCCKSWEKAELPQYSTTFDFMSVRHKVSISKFPPVLFPWRLNDFHMCYQGNFPRKTLYVEFPIREMLFMSRKIFRLKYTGVVSFSTKTKICLYCKTDNSVKGETWFNLIISELVV
jgi:hypothetical protein